MAEQQCGLFVYLDLRDNSNDLSVVDWLSRETSGKIGPLPLLIFAVCKHSEKSIYFSRNDFLYTPNLSLMSNIFIFYH